MSAPRKKTDVTGRLARPFLVSRSQNAIYGHGAPVVADVARILNDRREFATAGSDRSLAFCKTPFRSFAGRVGRLVAKQQTAALLATAVDFAVMTACVGGAGMNPALGTACGALVGTVVGFVLGRRWVFRALESTAFGQAWRYVAVSLVSLVANAAGEALLVAAGMHYLAARPIISITVGLGWNLPMQQFFVFRRRR